MLTPTQNKIIAEIYKAVEMLDGGEGLLAIIGSWGDTLPDEEVLRMMQEINQ